MSQQEQKTLDSRPYTVSGNSHVASSWVYLKIRSLKIQPVFEAKNLSQNDSSSPCFLGIKNLGNFWMKVYEESPTKQLKFQSAEVAGKIPPVQLGFPQRWRQDLNTPGDEGKENCVSPWICVAQKMIGYSKKKWIYQPLPAL